MRSLTLSTRGTGVFWSVTCPNTSPKPHLVQFNDDGSIGELVDCIPGDFFTGKGKAAIRSCLILGYVQRSLEEFLVCFFVGFEQLVN